MLSRLFRQLPRICNPSHPKMQDTTTSTTHSALHPSSQLGTPPTSALLPQTRWRSPASPWLLLSTSVATLIGFRKELFKESKQDISWSTHVGQIPVELPTVGTPKGWTRLKLMAPLRPSWLRNSGSFEPMAKHFAVFSTVSTTTVTCVLHPRQLPHVETST